MGYRQYKLPWNTESSGTSGPESLCSNSRLAFGSVTCTQRSMSPPAQDPDLRAQEMINQGLELLKQLCTPGRDWQNLGNQINKAVILCPVLGQDREFNIIMQNKFIIRADFVWALPGSWCGTARWRGTDGCSGWGIMRAAQRLALSTSVQLEKNQNSEDTIHLTISFSLFKFFLEYSWHIPRELKW